MDNIAGVYGINEVKAGVLRKEVMRELVTSDTYTELVDTLFPKMDREQKYMVAVVISMAGKMAEVSSMVKRVGI